MDVQNFLTNKVGSEGLPILNKEDWRTVHADVSSDDFREEIAEWIVMHEPPYPRKVSLQNPQKADNKFLELCAKSMDKHIKPVEQTHDVLEKCFKLLCRELSPLGREKSIFLEGKSVASFAHFHEVA